jgi:parvulin-like peptidyl-prolyl isomerase
MVQCPSNCTSNPTAARRTKRKRLSLVLGSLAAVGLCMAARYYWGAQPASAQVEMAAQTAADNDRPAVDNVAPAPPARGSSDETARAVAPSSPRDPATPTAIVATVNTQRITRSDLALQCRRSYGQEVLESMVNKFLIVEACRQQGVSVTRAEVDQEIERMATRFGIPVDQWLKLLKQERNVTPTQYANDIIWPALALRKLAGGRLSVTREELVKEFEIEYGEAVRVRLIAVSSSEKAKQLQAQAAAKPDDFGNLAKTYSEDAASASSKGMINPIRKHGSYKEIEDAVFNMNDGEVSPVIHAGGQYVILKREALVPARQVRYEQAAPRLEEVLRDRKMRAVAPEIFQKLQKDAKVENVWNDPAKRDQMPGVAATINGVPITIRELDEECVARHGTETLEGMINRKILEQACQQRNTTIAAEDINQEIARSALAGVKPKPDGSPNVEAWLELVTKKQHIPLDVYQNDVVWPTVALKKLAGDKIEVNEEDLRKGFEANFGPRARCLAIVLDNARRAQQVFDLARKNNTAEYFGQLAEQYSIEASSRTMHGEVPPIKKFGGQPKLEDEAFSLRPGEISGVIQVGDKYVILRCEGFTKPANVDFAAVRKEIQDDLCEKKLRLAMAERFDSLKEAATVDNYLAGTSHSPKRRDKVAPAANVPALRQVPGQ